MGTQLREIVSRGPDSKVGSCGEQGEVWRDFGHLQLVELELGWWGVNQGSCLYGALGSFYLLVVVI